MATARNRASQIKHRRIIAQGEPPCSLCGLPIDYTISWPDPRCYVLDHIIPLALGGSDSITNKRPAHNLCNMRRHTQADKSVVKSSGTLKRPQDF